MEGTRGRVEAMLALQREFAGSRLEQQALVRAYELAVPPFYRIARAPEREQSGLQSIRTARRANHPRLIEKGA